MSRLDDLANSPYEVNDVVAKQILEDAKAPKAEGQPYAHEREQGHWDLPKGALTAGTCGQTNAKLFKEFPYWALIAVFNPSHVHTAKDGKRHAGVWWIHEANPNHFPRKWQACFPLLIREHDDGQLWVDRTDGNPTKPADCWECIVRTVRHKDPYGPFWDNVGDHIKQGNDRDEALKVAGEEKLKSLGKAFFADEIVDQRPKASRGGIIIPGMSDD